MWTDVGTAQWVVMGLMMLLMALLVGLVGWLLTAPLWERLQRRRAEMRRSRLRAARRSTRFERKQSSGGSRAASRRR